MTDKDKLLDAEALAFHANGRPGKFQIAATKPLTSQHDLSLAYSPGVAAPCLEIAADINTAYDIRSNFKAWRSHTWRIGKR